jgi:hypothetical protein
MKVDCRIETAAGGRERCGYSRIFVWLVLFSRWYGPRLAIKTQQQARKDSAG